MSFALQYSPRPAPWQVIYYTVLHGIPSTFASLAVFAHSGSDGPRRLEWARPATEIGEEDARRTLTGLHIRLLDHWLGAPLEEQKLEVEHYLRHAGTEQSALGRVRVDGFRGWIPASAEPARRKLFRADLRIALATLRAERRMLQGEPEPSDSELRHVVAILEKAKHSNGDIRLTLGRLGAPLGISAKLVGEGFRRQTGVRFRDYLRGARMLRAAHLLTETRWPEKKIADLLGYKDESDFCRDFCREFNRSPSRYRIDSVDPIELSVVR